MSQNNKNFFTQKVVNIIIFGVFIFIIAMMYKNHRDIPEDNLSEVKDSETYVKNNLAKAIVDIYGKPVKQGYKNRGKHVMRYELVYSDKIMSIKDPIELLKELEWVELKKIHQPITENNFCKEKYLLNTARRHGHFSFYFEYNRLSPCWNLEKTLENNYYDFLE